MEKYIEFGKLAIEVGIRTFVTGVAITLVMVIPAWTEIVLGAQVVLKWGLSLIFGGVFLFTIGILVPATAIFISCVQYAIESYDIN